MVDKIWYNMEELIGGSEERGINRNILECKDNLEQYVNVEGVGINRNILECKVGTGMWSHNVVWGINRNILECKEIYTDC